MRALLRDLPEWEMVQPISDDYVDGIRTIDVAFTLTVAEQPYAFWIRYRLDTIRQVLTWGFVPANKGPFIEYSGRETMEPLPDGQKGVLWTQTIRVQTQPAAPASLQLLLADTLPRYLAQRVRVITNPGQ